MMEPQRLLKDPGRRRTRDVVDGLLRNPNPSNDIILSVAARVALGWDLAMMAERTGLSATTLTRMESLGNGMMATYLKVYTALENAGIALHLGDRAVGYGDGLSLDYESGLALGASPWQRLVGAGRVMLLWRIEEFASRAGIDPGVLRQIEAGEIIASQGTLRLLGKTLWTSGVAILHPGGPMFVRQPRRFYGSVRYRA